MTAYTLWAEQHEDVGHDPWAPCTPSDRPARYHEYKRAQLHRGTVFKHLEHLKFCRERLIYWKKRDGAMSPAARLSRDAFYDRLEDLRLLSGPRLPGMDTISYRRAA